MKPFAALDPEAQQRAQAEAELRRAIARTEDFLAARLRARSEFGRLRRVRIVGDVFEEVEELLVG